MCKPCPPPSNKLVSESNPSLADEKRAELDDLRAHPPVDFRLAWQLLGPLLVLGAAGVLHLVLNRTFDPLQHLLVTESTNSGLLTTFTQSLFSLQYALPDTWFEPRTNPEHASHSWINQMHAKGPLDAFMALTWAIALTAIRAGVMRYILMPCGQRFIKPERAHGLKYMPPSERTLAIERCRWATEKKILRFAEQGWCVVYYIPSWTIGLWVAYRQPYWFLNMREYWTGYPEIVIDGLFKFYYLFQLGFWLHQLLVINVEDKRSDYIQMCSHHLITIALISSSYGMHCHRIGNAILCMMDPSDILLSAAKCLRYMQWQLSCDSMFVVFVISWFFTRHILFNMTIWSVHTQAPRFVPMVWEPQHDLYFSPGFQRTMLFLLASLQLLLVIWFGMIVRVAWRVVSGGEAHDSRSDRGSDEEDEDEEETKPSKLNSKSSQQGQPDTFSHKPSAFEEPNK